jgi:hypothetical protein
VLKPNDGSVASVTVDGVKQAENAIPLLDDHQEHSVEMRITTPDKTT